MTETETLQRWTDLRQRVTDGHRTGHVIGYAAIDGNPYKSRAQVQEVAGRATLWMPLADLRELGMRPQASA